MWGFAEIHGLHKDIQRIFPLRHDSPIKVRWCRSDPASDDLELDPNNIKATLRLLQSRHGIDKLIVELDEA